MMLKFIKGSNNILLNLSIVYRLHFFSLNNIHNFGKILQSPYPILLSKKQHIMYFLRHRLFRCAFSDRVVWFARTAACTATGSARRRTRCCGPTRRACACRRAASWPTPRPSARCPRPPWRPPRPPRPPHPPRPTDTCPGSGLSALLFLVTRYFQYLQFSLKANSTHSLVQAEWSHIVVSHQ